jgi:hypothetical protein
MVYGNNTIVNAIAWEKLKVSRGSEYGALLHTKDGL